MMGGQTRDTFSSLVQFLKNSLARNFSDFVVDESLVETLLTEVNILRNYGKLTEETYLLKLHLFFHEFVEIPLQVFVERREGIGIIAFWMLICIAYPPLHEKVTTEVNEIYETSYLALTHIGFVFLKEGLSNLWLLQFQSEVETNSTVPALRINL